MLPYYCTFPDRRLPPDATHKMNVATIDLDTIFFHLKKATAQDDEREFTFKLPFYFDE